jgi:putrescine aminotransferase
VALENIRIIEEEKMIENIRDNTGPYLAKRWKELGEHPLVGEARVVGMVGALELVPNKPSRAYFPDRGAVGQMCRDFALANGLILRATNDAMLLSPPLIITCEQIDEMFAKAWKSLDQTAAALGMGGAPA